MKNQVNKDYGCFKSSLCRQFYREVSVFIIFIYLGFGIKMVELCYNYNYRE